MRQGRIGIALLALFALATFGCATSAGQQAFAVLTPDLASDAIDALGKIKELPILKHAAADAKATQAWADANLKGKEPLKYQLASACPTATNAVIGEMTANIDGLIALLKAHQQPPEQPTAGLMPMLFLTQLKYGEKSADPKAQIGALKDKMALHMDALFTGCAHLFPKKQVNDLAKLLTKAGILATNPALAPIAGALLQ